MARNEQLIRQHKVLQVLERVRFGKTLAELQADIKDELGLTSLHTRTIRRDLEALQAAGIDVDVHDSQRGKVWKLGPRAKSTTKISFSATELISLSLGREMLHPLAGTPFWMGIESFWKKIQDSVPAGVLDHYKKYSRTLRVLGVPTKSYEKHHGMIKTINRAIVEHRTVEIEYQAPGKPKKTRRIEPYTIALFQSSLYIICGACEMPNETQEDTEKRMRSLKLDRFSKATIEDAWFKMPKGMNWDDFVGKGMGIFVGTPQNFRIRIAAKAANFVAEDPWHPDQKIKELKNGDIELSVPSSNKLEIFPRVMSLMDDAEVIGPPKAKKEFAEIVKKIAKKYK